MDLQLLIVIITGIAVAVKLIRSIYNLFVEKRDNPYCGGCKGCDISNMVMPPKKE
ncbi:MULTISPECIES: hypothetical protein [Proteiniphilum]|jgi:hypothetical protein|uniref:hypothetical protein n=1 Tax=Proteiniphilum TaxID=294702 RepID=UPI001EEC51D6|nr:MULTISPECIES: hypothetical protein [Proteiniphilum]ULB34994.1 hypothetical protein KDN43_02795 [Proteiniphilum propionicum]